jgi:hypothetical protein
MLQLELFRTGQQRHKYFFKLFATTRHKSKYHCHADGGAFQRHYAVKPLRAIAAWTRL